MLLWDIIVMLLKPAASLVHTALLLFVSVFATFLPTRSHGPVFVQKTTGKNPLLSFHIASFCETLFLWWIHVSHQESEQL